MTNLTKILLISLSVYSTFPAIAETQLNSVSVLPSGGMENLTGSELIAKMRQELKEQTSDDRLLAAFFRVPLDKRQYIFPAIHEEPFLSHKVKTHPDVIIWKNKKPTKIAPQLDEFAKQHLDNLPAMFYPFLDPDLWASKPVERPLFSETAIDMSAVITPTVHGIDYAYPSLSALFELAPEKLAELKKTDLTDEVITQIQTLLGNLNTYATKVKDIKKLQDELDDLSRYQSENAMADPFAFFASSLALLGEKESFEEFVRSQGFKNTADFTDKADRLLKAVRTKNLSLPLAIYFNHVRAEQPIIPNTPLSNTQMFARMYEAKLGDVYFVAQKEEELKKMFQKFNLGKWGIPIYID